MSAEINKATSEKASDNLQPFVNRMGEASVLVIGDIMLDRFVYGEVNRISPESPVPVLRIKNENRMLGGAGNVLSNLHGLGVQAFLIAVTGDDEEAKQVRALVSSKKADPENLVTVRERFTTVKTRFLASHQQLLRTDYEHSEDVGPAVEDELIARAEKLLPQAGAVILSDYGKGVLTPRVTEAVIAAAAASGIPVLVDPKKSDYSIYKGASVITPNRKELADAAKGMPTATDEDIVKAARSVIEGAGIGAIVATRSQDGMSIIRKKAGGYEPPVHLRTEALEVFDVSGAGDTVIATVAAGLAAGADLVQAAALANIAGGIVVAKVGTASIRRSEILERLDQRDSGLEYAGGEGSRIIDTARQARLCDWDEALETVQRWKARGKKVGLTNGCFDILHPGHVTYLNQARARCDKLVIALNADESVRRLKGPSRPVNDEVSRSTVIGALGAVDMVVLFGKKREEDDKPVALIEMLKPDIYFKGGDYKIEHLPEAPVVRAYGGKVEIMDLVEGHSTTNTLRKASEEAA